MKLTLAPNAVQIEPGEHAAPGGPPTPTAPVVARTPPVAFLANVAQPVAALCHKAVALCRRIAPLDLAGLPIYIVPQSAIAAQFGDAASTYGYTMQWLDWVLHDPIGTAWQGRGPCIVVNDLAMTQDLGPDIEVAFLATVIHELAHVFERDMRYDARPDISADRLVFERLKLAHDVEQPVPACERVRTYHQHDQRFIRAVLHLRHRAERCGAMLVAAMLFNDGPAVYVTPFDYLLALQNEPERRIDAGIREILASPVPPAFARLWAVELELLTRLAHSPKETT